jgi:hypothetical protein
MPQKTAKTCISHLCVIVNWHNQGYFCIINNRNNESSTTVFDTLPPQFGGYGMGCPHPFYPFSAIYPTAPSLL